MPGHFVMHFAEPVTALTDYMLGIASLYFAFSLNRSTPARRFSVRLWSIGFFISAIAAFIGGTYHALKLDADASVLGSLWNVTIFLIGASGAFMISGVLVSSISGHDDSRKWLLRGVWVTLAGFVIQQRHLQLSEYFNHNDIFHLVQIGAFYCFFRGAVLLQDARGQG